MISQARKAILIQSVGQSIPIYMMSCLLFPKGFIQEINMILAGFWWGDTRRGRKIHWKNWDSLCVSKLDGGLGFCDFEAFNLALLAKQWWRLVHNENSLSFQVLKARYFPYTDPHLVELAPKSYFLWRSMLKGREIVERGAVWRVGDGTSINIWHSKWIPHLTTGRPSLPGIQEPTPMRVSKLIDADRRV